MLTYVQDRVLRAIIEHRHRHGVSPSYRELGRIVGGMGAAHEAMKRLEERGFIRRLPHKARAIEVLRLPPSMNGVCPTCGQSRSVA
jgi:repressor LexA